jgi:methylamine--corrinoid protein Co-methyltransferase
VATNPSGRASQSASGRFEGHVSPLEARFTAQVSHAVEGMSRSEAQPIVQSLVDKYAADVANGLIGKPFQEAYDLDTLEPTDEWQGLYEAVCVELEDEFGLVLES